MNSNRKQFEMNNKYYLLKFVFIFFLSAAYCQEIRGKVVGISDGDTFTLLTRDKKQIKVRLSEIDTPERDQPYGTRAKQALSDLVFSRDVLVVQKDIDFRGRLIGHVYVDSIHINKKMVQLGMAWVYRQYMKDKTLLIDQQVAKDAKKGLWSLPSIEQVPPWEWRKASKTKSKSKPQVVAQMYDCGTKTKCSEMTTCEEAKFYLENCRLTTIDGDGDGLPCEALCQ